MTDKKSQYDPIPFALLRKKYPEALSLLLIDKPRVLTAEEYLTAGCPVQLLETDGLYKKAELLCVYRADYRPIKTFLGHTGIVTALSALSSGSIVSVSTDKTIRTWNPRGGTFQVRLIDGCQGEIYSLAVLDDGTIVTGNDAGRIHRWDMTSESTDCVWVISNAHTGNIISLASLSRNRFASGGGSFDTRVRIWDRDAAVCLVTLDGHGDAIYCILELANGAIASCSGSKDSSIRVWNGRQFSDNDRPLPVEVEAQTNAPASSTPHSITLRGHTHGVYALVQLGNGQLASGSWDSTIRIWNVTSQGPFDEDLSHSENNLTTMILRGHSGWVRCMCVLADGVTLVSGSADKTIRIWDTTSGSCLSVLTDVHTDYVVCMSVLPDGVTVATGSRDRTIRLSSC